MGESDIAEIIEKNNNNYKIEDPKNYDSFGMIGLEEEYVHLARILNEGLRENRLPSIIHMPDELKEEYRGLLKILNASARIKIKLKRQMVNNYQERLEKLEANPTTKNLRERVSLLTKLTGMTNISHRRPISLQTQYSDLKRIYAIKHTH